MDPTAAFYYISHLYNVLHMPLLCFKEPACWVGNQFANRNSRFAIREFPYSHSGNDHAVA